MLFSRKMIPCDCGYGPGWYHFERDGKHEYNPDVSAEQACSRYQDDRRPIAWFYGHIDGPFVQAEIEATGTKKRFKDKDYDGHAGAFKAAARWTMTELESQAPIQMELF